jgi:hypothetical protein
MRLFDREEPSCDRKAWSPPSIHARRKENDADIRKKLDECLDERSGVVIKQQGTEETIN